MWRFTLEFYIQIRAIKANCIHELFTFIFYHQKNLLPFVFVSNTHTSYLHLIYICMCTCAHMCKHNTHWQKQFHCCLIWILTFLNMKVIINSQISTCKSPYYIITLKTHWLLLVNHHTNFCITIFTRPLEEIVTQSKLKDLFLDHISLTA